MSLASSDSRPVPAQANASPGLFSGLFPSGGDRPKDAGSNSQSGGMLDTMSRLVGLGGSTPTDNTPAKPKPAAKPTQTAAATPARPKSVPAAAPAQTEVKSANAAPAKPQPQTSTDTQQEAVNTANLLRGAQATVPAGSFDSRWSAMH